MDRKEIVVAFPANVAFPLALVFGLTSKVLSEDGSLGIKREGENRVGERRPRERMEGGCEMLTLFWA